MRISWKIKGTEAQHTIEYAVLLTLIMAGIIIAGPYVTRSWNANLKGWDDSVQDSLQDQLLEVPAASVPITGCDPQAWADEGCGLGSFDPCTGAVFSCGPQEKLMSQAYIPPGCQCAIIPAPPVSLICDINDANHCCTPWAPNPPTIADCGINATPPCLDGQYRANRVCDTGYTETNCIADPICVFNCTTPPFPGTPPHYGAMCAGDSAGLSGNIMNSFVESGECTNPTKCETECGVGYYPLGAGPAAYCGSCTIIGIQRTGCAFPQLDLRGCGVTHFKPCCYSP